MHDKIVQYKDRYQMLKKYGKGWMFGKIRNLNSTYEEIKGRLNLANSCFHPPNSYRLRSSVFGSGGECMSSVFRIKKKNESV